MPLFPHQKNDDNLEAAFSCFLAPTGGPRPCKIKLKRCKGVQKRGSHLFKKSGIFLQTQTKNDIPWEPQRVPKIEKGAGKDLPKTNLQKT